MPRNSHTATLMRDGTVLVAGGISNVELASAELYDPTRGTWTATGSMIEARYGHTATLLPDGTLLVAGGFTGRGDKPVASAEVYDPRSGTWTATGRMIEARSGHTATLLPDGKVLVAGGGAFCCGGGSPLASAELYDPNSGRWTATGSMAEARVGHTATLLPDRTVLVAGGFNGEDVSPFSNARASAELYDPSNGSWTSTASMVTPRGGHATTLLPDGTVLVVGPGTLAPPELYDPISGSWAATANMDGIRWDGTATLLLDGKVLVAGGRSDDGRDALASAELYDPSNGSWAATASMVTPRQDHTATLLDDGRVLVAGGGVSGRPDDGKSAELYDP